MCVCVLCGVVLCLCVCVHVIMCVVCVLCMRVLCVHACVHVRMNTQYVNTDKVNKIAVDTIFMQVYVCVHANQHTSRRILIKLRKKL